MKLYGNWHSPYTRRAGISLRLYGMDFALVETPTSDRATLDPLNPLGRIPALVLDDGAGGGEVLIDSAAILDHLDEIAGPARALVPASGARRCAILRIVAVALGTADKYVAACYEETKRPESHRWQPVRDRLADQVDAGLGWLAAQLADTRAGPRFFPDTDRPDTDGKHALTQAEVTTIAMIDAIRFDMAHLAPQGRWPKLDALCESVSDMPAFSETRPVPKGP